MSHLWSDDLFPPLDITATARYIANLWRHATHMAEREARQEQERQKNMPDPSGEAMDILRFRFTVLESQFGDSVIEALRAYDLGRTKQIEFLKSQLMELHNRMPPAPVVIERKTE